MTWKELADQTQHQRQRFESLDSVVSLEITIAIFQELKKTNISKLD